MALKRARQGRIIAGVCAGLARHLDWSAGRVRLAYVALSVLSAAFPGIIVYVILWFLIPNDDA